MKRAAQALLLMATSAFAQDANPLLGAWRLVSVETIRPNGEAVKKWLGEKPTGLIVYLPSGVMAVQVMKDPRPVPGVKRLLDATQAEKAAAAEGYYAYFGTYEVDMSAKTVTHHLESSLWPEEVGIDYKRKFELVGDVVTLTTPKREEEGEMRYNRLRWRRVR
jgi:hypothetical protein